MRADDGSGSLTLLEVATRLTNFTVNNCVRFAWWAGEEEVSGNNLRSRANASTKLVMNGLNNIFVVLNYKVN